MPTLAALSPWTAVEDPVRPNAYLVVTTAHGTGEWIENARCITPWDAELIADAVNAYRGAGR